MKSNIYSVYDEKAGAYLQPFFLQKDALAVRAVSNALHDPDHNFSVNAGDYTLYCIGEWDDENATLTSSKRVVVTLLELKAKKAEAFDSVLGDTNKIIEMETKL